MNLDPSNVSAASMNASSGSSLHNSLASYMTQQVPLLFGQQQTQQQPLNLQTSPHQGGVGGPLQHQGSHHHHVTTGGTGIPHGVPHPPPPLPLNLHNPYYVSFGLPFHMSAQHNHQQQFEQNLVPPQQHSFHQQAMYQ